MFFENCDGDDCINYSLNGNNGFPVPLHHSLNDNSHILRQFDIEAIHIPEENEPFVRGVERFYNEIGGYIHDGILFIRPNHISLRMMMQQGLFIVPDQLSRDYILNKFDDLCTKIIIDKSLPPTLLNYLSERGFDSTRLMPNFDGLCGF